MTTTVEPGIKPADATAGAAAGHTNTSAEQREASAGTTASKSMLAEYGGPRAVTAKSRDKWRQNRLRDLWPIVMYTLLDKNTQADAGGVVGWFERKFALLADTRFALTMNSGTAALHSAYFAVGVKPGTEVIVPAYTFFASAAPILQCGGTPVFCDIDEKTLLIDPDDVERRITERTRAICAVHLWGNPANMDRLVEIAKKHNLAIVEDCSHAHGATYKGQHVGSFGDVGCFSLQGKKAVSGGECGIAVTNDPVIYDKMLAFGHYGRSSANQQANTFPNLSNMNFGIKYRPHLFGVCLAFQSLKRLPKLNELRRRNYRILCEELADCDVISPVGSYDDTERGGFLEFILRYRPELCGDLNVGTFVNAAKAEGVPVYVDRYTRQGDAALLLPELGIFSGIDYGEVGGYIGGESGEKAPACVYDPCPVAERLCSQLIAMPALTNVSEEYVRQCAAALKKVAKQLPLIKDFRTGD